ncbi:transporter substrate-binding domain-containing protein [Mesorhizobium xinjiangense]|uniref:transporter substrate-binding domain-containing protein n=1 Tax=Mesorhizobium xinjiangense TaxID=2678685 RepID=UPI0012EE7102|nr:transporter substrate-binding domain-containing protein [Mesorhizobium xinjiangense]
MGRSSRTIRLSAVFLLAFLAGRASAEEPAIPNLWDAHERLAQPDLSGRTRLRFLTTIDFPPFNYLTTEGRLAGFNVDLARAICMELDLSGTCQIQALPWDEIEQALSEGQGDAVIAGVAMTPQSRSKYAFSRPYLIFPGRFVTADGLPGAGPLYARLRGKRIGVMAGSAHERALRELFGSLRVVTYSKRQWMFEDLRDGNTDAVFGDGMQLSFWLAGSASQGCCRFAGGPYLLPDYFGPGMAIAVRPDDIELTAAFNHALREIDEDGTFAELYLRYFPLSFF